MRRQRGGQDFFANAKGGGARMFLLMGVPSALSPRFAKAMWSINMVQIRDGPILVKFLKSKVLSREL